MTRPDPDPAQQREAVPDDAEHILVVDDDKRIRDLVTRLLAENGFRVTGAADAQGARTAMRGFVFDLILMDVMMPGESGISLARDLKRSSSVPICLLTARDAPDERVEGLEAGVDDYVVKPFEPRELILRLRNILRRTQTPQAPLEEVRMGEHTFHITRGELRLGDEMVKLTERERDLMRLFAQRPGVPIPRHELSPDATTGSERAIDVQINRLRRKIEADPANPVYLQTVRGKGYILYIE